MFPRELKLRAKLAWLDELERQLPSPNGPGSVPLNKNPLNAHPLAAVLARTLYAQSTQTPTALPQDRQDEASAASVAPKLLHVAPSSA